MFEMFEMWILFAFASAFFAGITSVLAKVGLQKTDSYLTTALRTVVVLIFAWFIVFYSGVFGEVWEIGRKSLLFLVLSGITTGASWICYFKALQLGDVSKVVPVDKSSTILTMILAFLILSEPVTLNMLLGMIIIGTGTYLMIRKKNDSKTVSGTETENLSDPEIFSDPKIPSDPRTSFDLKTPSDQKNPFDLKTLSDQKNPFDLKTPSDQRNPFDLKTPSDPEIRNFENYSEIPPHSDIKSAEKNEDSDTVGKGGKKSDQRWLIFAFLSALFAALTSILGKIGIEDVNSNLGTAVRTIVVLMMAWLIVFYLGKQKEIQNIDTKSWIFIILSGLATGLSWLFFFGALKGGLAAVVVPIDKLSILVTVIFAYVFLKERVTKNSWFGLLLVTAGTLLLLVQL